jgi:hypothetical protein
MGFRGKVARSKLTDANERCDWRIYPDWAQTLIRRVRKLYATEPFAPELDQTVYALDATVIDLSMSLFPWARFSSTNAAIKLYTLLDLGSSIPTFVALTEGLVHDGLCQIWAGGICLGLFISGPKRSLIRQGIHYRLNHVKPHTIYSIPVVD